MTGQIERLEWSDVSKKSLRKITRAKKCSSNGKCCSIGSASTDQNHCYRLVIAKTKIMSRHWGFLSSGWIQNQKRLNCDDRFFLMLCERERIAVQSGCQRHSPAKTKKYLAQEKFQRMAQGTKAQVSLSKWWNEWVAPDRHYWCSTNNKNDQLFQHKYKHNRKNKRKIWKQKTMFS